MTWGATRRVGCLTALLCCAILADYASAQAPPPQVFGEVQTALGPLVNPALEPATMRSRVVQVNTQKITAARRGREVLKLNLFDDAVVEVDIRRVRPTRTGYFISGRPKGKEWGDVRLVVNGPIMVGTVITPEGEYTIRSAGSNRHVIRQIDPSKEPFECNVGMAPLADGTEIASSSFSTPFSSALLPPTQTDNTPTEDGSEIRMLVVYTPAAQREEGGEDGMRALIDLLIHSINQAFEDSGINPRIVLAHAALLDYVEAADGGLDQRRLRDPNDGYMDEVHSLRNQYAADLIHLLSAQRYSGSSGATTYSEHLSEESKSWAATSIVVSGAVYIFMHETGHNLGLRHDRYVEATSAGGGLYPYAHGYVNQRAFEPGAPDSTRWSTIMAYPNQCAQAGFNCERLWRYSNPDQSLRGDPLGVPADSPITGTGGPADARLTINNIAPWVGSFRSEACVDFAVSPETPVASMSGGEVLIRVETAPGCLWEVSSQSDFLTVNSDELNAGPGVVTVAVMTNPNKEERNGSLTVADRQVRVRQLATNEGVCGRSSTILEALAGAAGYASGAQCDEVTDDDLARIESLDLSNKSIEFLQEGDFSGLSGFEKAVIGLQRIERIARGPVHGSFSPGTAEIRLQRIERIARGPVRGSGKTQVAEPSRQSFASATSGTIRRVVRAGTFEPCGQSDSRFARNNFFRSHQRPAPCVGRQRTNTPAQHAIRGALASGKLVYAGEPTR